MSGEEREFWEAAGWVALVVALSLVWGWIGLGVGLLILTMTATTV